MEKVELMKKKGDFNKQKLAELGLADFETEEVSPVRKNLISVDDDISGESMKPSIVIE
jgi:hypothetical protein